ncbi:MAG: hypothetical protein M1820_000256 [Bogoriella megaspora]|nr:MAG: hypothetical protein M1820_000256 [Bogoriella megaspora]
MARLNDAPAPAESLEALKRRFLRQNRELAKYVDWNNSNQSLRISALEGDIQRLVAENVSLKEHVNHLQLQLDRREDSYSVDHVMGIRDNIQAKLEEMTALIANLGKPTETSDGDRLKAQKPPSRALCRPERAANQDQDFERDGRLAPIDENGNEEHTGENLRQDEASIVRLSDQTNESPDIGPPPIAHFECDDPIKFDTKTSQLQSNDPEIDDMPANVFANLETRRKRRESNTRFDSRRSQLFQSLSPDQAKSSSAMSVVNQNARTTLKAGAKRKMSAREGLPETTDFHYSRKPSSVTDTVLENVVNEKEITSIPSTLGDSSRPIARNPRTGDGRQVLGNKNANISPRKVSESLTSRTSDEKRTALKSRNNTSDKEKARSRAMAASQDSNAVVMETVLPPKTPGLGDLASPTSTGPSTARTDSRDTPPPNGPSLSALSSASSAATGRVPRRARAQVNYAEPNLVSKMRRPTEKLSDAISGRDRPIKEEDVGTEAELKAGDGEKSAIRTVVIKRENSEPSWKSLPNTDKPDAQSPLRHKGADTQRSNNGASNDQSKSPTNQNDTSHADTALANAAVSRRRNERSAMTGGDVDHTAEKMESLAIYDFNESSPADELNESRHASSKIPNGRFARRHSSIHDISICDEEGKLSTAEILKAEDERPSIQSNQHEVVSVKKRLSVRSGSVKRDDEAPGLEQGRSVRAARRRSMMA